MDRLGERGFALAQVRWLNSVGELAPSGLLVERLEDLCDGVALCELALHVAPGARERAAVAGALERNVCSDSEARGNLAAAARCAVALGAVDAERADTLLGARSSRQLVVELLTAFRRALEAPRSAISKRMRPRWDGAAGAGIEDPTIRGRSAERSAAPTTMRAHGAERPTASTASLRDRAKEFSKSVREQVRRRKSLATTDRGKLGSRPSWNISVATEGEAAAPRPASALPDHKPPRKETLAFHSGSMVDPTYVPKSGEAELGRSRGRSRGRSASRATASASPPPPPPPPPADAPGAAVAAGRPTPARRRRSSSSIGSLGGARQRSLSPHAAAVRPLVLTSQDSVLWRLSRLARESRQVERLSAAHRDTLEWLLHPALLPRVFARFRAAGAPLGLDLEELSKADLFALVAGLFKSGVLLCELVAALERATTPASALEAEWVHKAVPRSERRGHSRVLVLAGVQLGVRLERGARAKNVAVALALLRRRRPRMPSRHLFSVEQLVDLRPAAALWELLSDVREEYGPLPPPADDAPHRAGAAPDRGLGALFGSAGAGAAGRSTYGRPRANSLDERRLRAWPYGPFDPARAAGEAQSTGSVASLALGGYPTARRRRAASLRSRNGATGGAASGATSGPAWWVGEEPQPAHQSVPAAAEAPHSPQQQVVLAAWLLGLGLPGLAARDLDPLLDVPLLDDVTRNGSLLLALARAVDPESAAARLASTGQPALQPPPPASAAAAVANTRQACDALLAALAAQPAARRPRASRARTLAALLSGDAEALVKGPRSLFWALLQAVHDCFTGRHLDSRSPRGGTADLGTHHHFKENNSSANNDRASSAAERLERSYRVKHDIVPGVVPVQRMNSKRATPKDEVHSTAFAAEPQLAVSLREPVLPYSPWQLDRLEHSLIAWLARIGVLARHDERDEDVSASAEEQAPEAAPRRRRRLPKSLLGSGVALRLACCSGDLLADAARTALPVTVPALRTVTRRPRTALVARANITKTLEALRVRPEMGRRFLFCEQQLADGVRTALLGLLADIRRAQDGLAPRPVAPSAHESAWLGPDSAHALSVPPAATEPAQHPAHPPSSSPPSREREHEHERGDPLERRPRRGAAQTTSPERIGVRRNPAADIWPSPFGAADIEALSQCRLSVASAPAQPLRRPLSGPLLVPGCAPSSGLSASSVLAPHWTGSRDAFRDTVPRPASLGSRPASPSRSAATEPVRAAVPPPVFAPPPAWAASIDVDALVEWLVIALRLPLRSPDDLRDLHGLAPEFVDGTLLCTLVERVAHIRGGLPGVQVRPRSQAASLHNIRAALQVLQANVKMPPALLWSERDIAAGRVAVVLPLLAQIKKVYA